MPITAACSRCGQRVRVDDALAGRAIHCPKEGCGSRIPIPDVPETLLGPAGPPPREFPPAIGRYQIQAVLGRGAFGTVYRAQDPALDRLVALKVPRFDATDPRHADLVQRFLREAQAAGRLSHPNVVPVHDTGRHGDDHYIAFAFVDGPTLAKLIPAGGLDPAVAAGYAVQLADALQHAHARGVVHRDVKPANCLVGPDGRLLLTDFGLSGWIDGEGTRLTRSGTVFGTPAYMAPEQAAGRTAKIGPAADQYAVGATLFHLLTGRPPFVGGLADVVYDAIHSPPPPPSALRPGLDPGLEAICLRALAKEPEERFPDCRALADALRPWLSGQAAAAGPAAAPGPAANVSTVLSPPARRSRWVWVWLTLALLAALAAGLCIG
jgi:serine/threonine-protein kinase